MHADEIPIDIQLVRDLIAEQFPAWADLPIRAARPFGTDNAIFRLGENLAVRLPRRDLNVPALLKEMEWLPRLAPSLSLAIPQPVAHGEPGSGYPLPWAIYGWIDGENATRERLLDARQAALDLAAFIQALQAIEAPLDLPNSSGSRGVPLAERDEAVRYWLGTLHGQVDED